MTNGKVVDTSIWIDYLNKKENTETRLVNSFIDKNEIITLPVIIQEVLQGIKEHQVFLMLKETFLTFTIAQYNNIEAAIRAAMLYRFLRQKGVTIRKPNDCLIAVICIDNDFPLLENDVDFKNIAKFTKLKLINKH
jgi:predicted nucleic acid-binding protein